MTEASAPRVKLPDTTPRKALVPGPNSWAQQQQQEQPRNTTPRPGNESRVTNRDKYEHKPMPPPPQAEEESSHGHYILPSKAYIQPAIPLVNVSPNAQIQKNRAVTDPIAPKPLFASRKVSVTQLRKKFSQSKTNGESPKDPSPDGVQAGPVSKVAPEKAAQVLGMYPVPDNSRNTPPSSAPPAPVPDPFSTSGEDSHERIVPPARQVQSSPAPTRNTPVPTRRYLKENGLPEQTYTGVPTVTQHYAVEHEYPEAGKSRNSYVYQPAANFLHPARIGTHSNVREVGLVEGSGMHRVESFRGVIEDVPNSSDSNGQAYTESYKNASQPSGGQSVYTEEHFRPDLYTPSNYGGVWENDPAVGRTLPPFTPISKGCSSNGDIGRQYNAAVAQPHQDSAQSTMPDSNYGTNRFLTYHHPFPSANSWASNNSHGNSSASPTAPLAAQPPHHWHPYDNCNSVPSPPQNQPDFQRAGSIPAALAHMNLTMSHHINSAFGSLSRLIINKHDQVMDHSIRRLEKLEEAQSKGFKDLKSEIGDLKKSVHHIQGDMKDIKKKSDRAVECVRGLDAKLQALEKHIEEHACKCQHSNTDQSASEPESDRQNRSTAASQTSHRRTESAHASVQHGEPRRQYQSGGSRTSNSTRISGTSSRRERSNTTNGQQPVGRMSDERSNRKEYFAELGAARGPVPDLRDHPAYADRQHVQGQAFGYGHDQNGMPMVMNGLPFENPSLSDGKWYQQAYGQHR